MKKYFSELYKLMSQLTRALRLATWRTTRILWVMLLSRDFSNIFERETPPRSLNAKIP